MTSKQDVIRMTRLVRRPRQRKRARLSPCPLRDNPELLFLVFVLDRLHATIVCGPRFGIFHRFPGFGGLLGADFGPLLALFVQHLFAAKQLEESFVGAVALIPASAYDTRVAAVTVAEAWANGIKKLHHGFVGHQVRACEASSGQVAALAQR